jgi:hypothetical protein
MLTCFFLGGTAFLACSAPSGSCALFIAAKACFVISLLCVPPSVSVYPDPVEEGGSALYEAAGLSRRLPSALVPC